MARWATPTAALRLNYQITIRWLFHTNYYYIQPDHPLLIITILLRAMHLLLLLAGLLCLCRGRQVEHLPLTYGYLPDLTTKIPITLSFNHSKVYSSSPTSRLHLHNYNLSVNIEPFALPTARPHIQIGLKHPSEFVTAVAASFGIPYEKVEFGKEDYLEVVLFDENFVESTDEFRPGDSFNVHVKYNFGDDATIGNKTCRLVDGDVVYFEEYLIRETLTKMSTDNRLNFKFHDGNGTISLEGELDNLPRLTLVRGNNLFKLPLRSPTLHYLPAIHNPKGHTLVGLMTLEEFDRFRLSGEGDSVVFKRTREIFQLYIYLCYFVFIMLLMVWLSRRSLFETGRFVQHIYKWAFLGDRLSRIEVMKAELQE